VYHMSKNMTITTLMPANSLPQMEHSMDGPSREELYLRPAGGGHL
jgi:hypothetical protein